ncbi:uncharacterized protein B0T15DRAFT_554842 [Chaetomium strumarium]|uniref:Xylanolytic transcriptional activator regulatory domain-containing protein n=1 Tax=Chaetomium strumarium TaxID=1170767 RepID=A0AAJ0GRY6_9PEZI|nr:hypothetical protein B0T15DRAFT_554842 [Chaetomium strumarium]
MLHIEPRGGPAHTVGPGPDASDDTHTADYTQVVDPAAPRYTARALSVTLQSEAGITQNQKLGTTGDNHVTNSHRPDNEVSLRRPADSGSSAPGVGFVATPGSQVSDMRLRYPVLEPLLPHLTNVLDHKLACDLLELYFETQPAAPMQPLSPFVLSSILRKPSFLQDIPPRQCKPILLASMLLVAAETVKSRSIIRLRQECNSLVCIRLRVLTQSFITTLSDGTLDDVIAYIHLATVDHDVNPEMSNDSWRMADDLARHLELERELESSVLTEEREEGRRVWWLLYMVNTCLALFGDQQRWHFVTDLFQPTDEADYQSSVLRHPQIRGISFQYTGHDIYGFLLPLTAILGDILDLRSTGRRDPISKSIDDQTRSITIRLDEYEESVKANARDVIVRTERQSSLAVKYGTYMVYVLRILLIDEKLDADRLLTQGGYAVKALEDILEEDRRLEFMPFFFGIFLSRGSWPLVLLASNHQSKMPPKLPELCEVLLRAHEACIATMGAQCQRHLREVLCTIDLRHRGTHVTDGELQQWREIVESLHRRVSV